MEESKRLVEGKSRREGQREGRVEKEGKGRHGRKTGMVVKRGEGRRG